MKLITDEQIARFLATEVLGWTYYGGSTMSVPIWRGEDGTGMPVAMWRPCADLNQAFMVLLKAEAYKALWSWQIEGIGRIYTRVVRQDGELIDTGFNDRTPAAVARAICVALCRAYGAEAEG